MRGGAEIKYITGEQVTKRLNEVLGIHWNFRVIEAGHDAEADERWALGEISIRIGDITYVRQQYGSQKVKRARATGKPLDVGFDLKGAATDAMKKTAMLFGVGLYLAERHPDDVTTNVSNAGTPTYAASAESNAAALAGSVSDIQCQFPGCGEFLKTVTFRNGGTWPVAKQVQNSKDKFGRIFCSGDGTPGHYSIAKKELEAGKYTPPPLPTPTSTPTPTTVSNEEAPSGDLPF